MKIGAAVLVLGLLPGAVMAQDSTTAKTPGERVAAAMRTANRKFEAPECSADKGLHFKISSAKVYLKTGIETPVDENKERALENGERVTLEAMKENGQDKSAGAWYYLGRIYLQKGDLAGADSALARAQALAPDCTNDINKYRHTAWVALINPGIDAIKKDQPDSAAMYFRLANQMYRQAPHGYYYLATIAFDKKDMPSALAYFDSALATPKDPKNAGLMDQASFNRAVVLLRLGRAPEAVTGLQEFVGSHPDDINAKKALMAAYQAASMPDSVASVAKQLEEAGETVARTEVVAKTPFNDAVAAFNDQHWADAAAAAQKVMADEPNNRDALYMLVASYYQLKDGPQLVRWGKQFTSLDPASESGLQMLGFGYNLTKDSKNAVATRLKLNALPVAISSPKMESTDSAASFTATATGRAATDMNGKAIAPHPVTMTVDFLNKDGATVTSTDVAVPALKEGETASIKASATGAGIIAWRYQLK